MKTGLWIDHRKAIIVSAAGRDETVKVVVSNATRQPSRVEEGSPGSHYDERNAPRHDAHGNLYARRLALYYDAVAANLRDSESILLFGPGEAKDELRKRLEKNRLGDRIALTETADKMTEPQLRAKVRRYFHPPK